MAEKEHDISPRGDDPETNSKAEVHDALERRSSVAMNIVKNPLKVKSSSISHSLESNCDPA